MTAFIIGCGQSAKDWNNLPCNISIGVNDCYKFGYNPDQLVLINFERKFTGLRLQTILATRSQKVWTHTSTWKKHFPKAEVIKLSPFNGNVRPGLIYSSKTSPMVAMSLAIKQGATELVLFGIDMVNHPSYRAGMKQGDFEIKAYLKFFESCNKQGIKVYRGADGSCFDSKLPLYELIAV
jgi:hypothetical protein